MSSPAETAVVEQQLRESSDVKLAMCGSCAPVIAAIAERVIQTYLNGGKLLLCGNGGSAADAQHIAAEMVGKFKILRAPWPAIALNANTSLITAIGNDWSFDDIFARQVNALGNEGDVLIAISTSGNSPNVLAAVEAARQKGLTTVGFTGGAQNRLRGAVDLCVSVPSYDTPRIQEGHITAAHIICDLVEKALANAKPEHPADTEPEPRAS